MAVTGKDDTMVEDQDQIETPQHKEYLEQGSIQTTEQLKNLSAVDLDKKMEVRKLRSQTRMAMIYVTHRPVEVTVQVGSEKHDGVAIPESGDQVHEAFEGHKEEEMHINLLVGKLMYLSHTQPDTRPLQSAW